MAKKMPIKKVLCCLVVIGIMICTIPVSVFAEVDSTVYSISPLSINELDNMKDAKVSILNEEFVAKSTAPEEEWNKTFGGPSGDVAYAVQQTPDGGYILAGSTESYDAGSRDAWLIKTDSKGNEQWNKTFGGSLSDGARAVQQTPDGGYIIAGDTDSYGAGDYDAWLIKTDSKGNKQWDKTFGGSGCEKACAVQQTPDGGYVIAGYTNSYGAGSWDAWLIKTDSKGNKQWNKTFGGSGGDAAYAVQQMPDGGYVIAGHTNSYGAGDYDAWLIKTDSKGNKQWDKIFGGSGWDFADAVQKTPDGGYILAGSTGWYVDGPKDDAWLVKTDSKGNKQWDKTFGGSGWDDAYAIQQTPDGGYVIAGYTDSYGAGSWDAWLIKSDSKGNEQWNKTFGGPSWDPAYTVQQTPDGGYILAGRTNSYGAGDYDVWLIKMKGDASKLTDPLSVTPELWSDSMQLDREGETVTLDAIVSGRRNVNVGETEIYTILLSIDYSDLSSSNRFKYGVPYFETGEIAVAYDDDACRLGNVEVLYFDDGSQQWEIPEDIPSDRKVWDAAANILIGKAIPFQDIANLLQLIFDSLDHQLTLSEEFYNENDYDVLVVPFAKVYHGLVEEQQYPIKIKVSVPLTFEKADRFNLRIPCGLPQGDLVKYIKFPVLRSSITLA